LYQQLLGIGMQSQQTKKNNPPEISICHLLKGNLNRLR
jgi:hypothetical protein